MSSHLVETSEEDSFTAVSRHIGELLNDGQVIRSLHSINTQQIVAKDAGNRGRNWPLLRAISFSMGLGSVRQTFHPTAHYMSSCLNLAGPSPPPPVRPHAMKSTQ